MKNKIIFCVLLISTIAQSQQNFFNVPSSDITESGKIFFQQQFNFSKKDLVSNTTINYGLGNNFEIGLNYLGLTADEYKKLKFNTEEEPYNPFLTINSQKKFDINNQFSVAVGALLGFTTTKPSKLGYLVFSNFIYNNEEHHLKCVFGLYNTSNSFVGKEIRNFWNNEGIKEIGFQIGVEKKIYKNLLFQADLISGKHTLGQTVVGLGYWVDKNIILSSGYQIPIMNSEASHAAVLEFTYVPK
ncbi:MAG: hypothetical protein KBA33_06630 [Cloacibacterium sp.]|nr:hypothetical protein [Cloacibacterium sp.]